MERIDNIDTYIEKSRLMENTSAGGSEAYHFGDVVLVKYIMSAKYGRAREDEEKVKESANKKNSMGVRTPKHLMIKRVREDDLDVCYVLQECAKGRNFRFYCDNSDSELQLLMQARLLNAPQQHCEKFIQDVCALFHSGIELKPKNIYYDEDRENGGFTIIDLLDASEEELDANSLKDVYELQNMVQSIANFTTISSYNKTALEVERQISKKYQLRMKQRIFESMEKVLPGFEKHKRWLLRSLDDTTREFFKENGLLCEDLSLNEEEYQQFDSMVKKIVDDSIQKVESGRYQFWQIDANEIRIDLDCWCLQKSYLYHRENKIKRADFTGEYADYDYCRASENALEDKVKKSFFEKLMEVSENSTNENLLQARADLIEYQQEQQRRKEKRKTI